MPFVRVDDLVVHYELTGPADAPVVAFGNSLGTSYHLWDDNVGALVDRFRLLRYDMRGHGLTSVTPGERRASVDTLTSDLVGLLDVLDIGRVRYVGLSIGGMVGQRFAATLPQRVEALALCATGSQLGTAELWNTRIAAVEKDGVASLVDGILARWFTETTRRERPDLVAGFGTMVARPPDAGYIGGCISVRDADLRADDRRIIAPTLIISGRDDLAAPPAAGEAMHAAIPGARLALLDGAAHILNAERPAQFNSLLATFLTDPARPLAEAIR